MTYVPKSKRMKKEGFPKSLDELEKASKKPSKHKKMKKWHYTPKKGN